MSTCTSQKVAKWQNIYEILCRDIRNGIYADKSDFFTLKELCRKFNVSNITAQRIFKELKLNGLIATVGRRGTIVTNSKAASRILLCLFKSEDPTGDPFKVGASYRFAEGFLKAKADTPFDLYAVSEDFLWNHLDEIEDDVVLDSNLLLTVEGSSVRLDQERVELLRKKTNPVIIHSFSGLNGFPQIGIDYYQGFYNATRYLIGKGHTKIAFLMSSKNVWHAPRLKGYMDALEENGFLFENDMVQIMPNQKQNTEADRKAMFDILKENSPSAFLCTSDRLALRIHNVCRKTGLRIPDDVAIMGFDNISESKLITPELTTMDSHLEQFGEAAVRLLERRRAGFDIGNEQIRINPTLIERQTT